MTCLSPRVGERTFGNGLEQTPTWIVCETLGSYFPVWGGGKVLKKGSRSCWMRQIVSASSELCVGHTLSLAWGLAVTSEPFVTAGIARDPRTHLSWIWGLHMASLGSAEHLAVFTWKKLDPVLK